MFLTGSLAVFIGAAHFDFAQYEPPPFRPPAGGFAGGIFSEKCVRTNLRIQHHVGKIKEFSYVRVVGIEPWTSIIISKRSLPRSKIWS